MFDDFITYTDSIQNMIFNYMFKDASKLFLEKISLWEKVVHNIPQEKLETFNSIMLEIFSAQEKKDYLLLADLLEYRVKPFVFSLNQCSCGGQS